MHGRVSEIGKDKSRGLNQQEERVKNKVIQLDMWWEDLM